VHEHGGRKRAKLEGSVQWKSAWFEKGDNNAPFRKGWLIPARGRNPGKRPQAGGGARFQQNMQEGVVGEKAKGLKTPRPREGGKKQGAESPM